MVHVPQKVVPAPCRLAPFKLGPLQGQNNFLNTYVTFIKYNPILILNLPDTVYRTLPIVI